MARTNYRKYRTRGKRKTRRKKNPNYFMQKKGNAFKAIFIIGIIGGGAWAAWKFKDKIFPDGIGSSKGDTPKIKRLKEDLAQIRSLMWDAQEAGDNETYVALQKQYQIIELEIEAEEEL